MAKDEAPEASEESGKGGSKKLIIIIALVALLAIGASVGVTWFLLSGDKGAEETVAEEQEPEEPVKGPAEYYKVKDPLVITYNVNGRQKFMQVHLTFLMRQAGVYDALDLHLPVIQNRLLNLFGEKDFMELQTHEGRIAAQSEAKDAINEMLAEQGTSGEIEKVLFTNFVMQ